MSQDTYRGEQMEPGTWNLYTYCANDPVNYTDPSGHKRKKVRIYLGVHHVAAGNYHASVLVFVSRGNKYYKDKRFEHATSNRDYGATSKYVAKYVTFGAGPGSQGKQSGRLIAERNRPKDVDLSNKVVMKRLLITNSNKKIKKLLNLNDNYISCPTKPKYNAFPSKKNKGYNSNSFAHGLLKYAGFSVKKPDKKLPGWSKVVPKSYFGLQGDA